MIQDSMKLQEIRDTWVTVRIFQAKVTTNLNAAFVGGGIPQTHEFRNLAHSLILLFAFSVLEDVLKQLKQEKVFSSGTNQLGDLMYFSKGALAWKAFALVDEGRTKRNELAHQRQLIERVDCWKYIDAIEEELVGWKILTGKVKADYTMTITGAR